MLEFEKAKDKINMGPERRTMIMTDKQKESTAYHEAAHAIVGYLVPEPDQRLYRIRLNDPTTVRLDAPVVIDGVRYECSYLELGDPGLPHAVVPYPNLAQADENALRELGRKIRFYPEFPKGANVNFCELTGENEVFERTFERGVEDFTYACGTGTGCVVTALTLMGKVSGRQVRVNMTGGQLIVDVDLQGSTVQNLYLAGPTNIVCKGEVTDEELSLN